MKLRQRSIFFLVFYIFFPVFIQADPPKNRMELEFEIKRRKEKMERLKKKTDRAEKASGWLERWLAGDEQEFKEKLARQKKKLNKAQEEFKQLPPPRNIPKSPFWRACGFVVLPLTFFILIKAKP